MSDATPAQWGALVDQIIANIEARNEAVAPIVERISDILYREPAPQVTAEILTFFIDLDDRAQLAWGALSIDPRGYRILTRIREQIELAAARHPELGERIDQALPVLRILTAPPGPTGRDS